MEHTSRQYERELQELGDKILFTNPRERSTEDYITGRFG